MDNGPFLAFMKDAAGRYVYENRRLTEHIGRIKPAATTCLGSTDCELFPPAEEHAYVDHDRKVIAGGVPLQFDEVSVDADGTVRHWSTVKFPQSDAQGRRCVAGISIDVTDSRRAEEQARDQAQQAALALEAGRMGTLTLDLATQTLETSPLFAVLHGRPETRTRLTIAESLAEVHPDDRHKVMEAVQAAIDDRSPTRLRYRVVRPDGGISWIELLGRVDRDGTGRPAIVRGVGFDVTDEQLAYEEITRSRNMLRLLIEVQENERRTLCHELHDGMMQYVIGAQMLVEQLRNLPVTKEQAETLEAILGHLARGLAEGRQVIRGVRSGVLDDLGLSAAILDLADQMQAAGCPVEVTLDADLDSLPPHLRTIVYRVVQESLANVRKHADATRATVEIRRSPAEVRVDVGDDGKGFEPTDESHARGFGLVGMTERVRLAGGSLTVDSGPGAGTRVHAILPTLEPSESVPLAGPPAATRLAG